MIMETSSSSEAEQHNVGNGKLLKISEDVNGICEDSTHTHTRRQQLIHLQRTDKASAPMHCM